jgi:hypothetical protein
MALLGHVFAAFGRPAMKPRSTRLTSETRINPIKSRQIAALNPQPWTNTKCIGGQESSYAVALRGSAGASSVHSKSSISASVWAAVKASLSLAVPAGTVGGLIAVAK